MRRAALSKQGFMAIVIGVIVIIAGVGFGVYQTDKQADTGSKTSASQVKAAKDARVEPVVYQGQTGKSALEILKSIATVQTKDSTYGEYVVSIDGNDGGGKKYWTFYVNGKMASVSAADYITKDGEAIEWKLQ